MVSRYLTRLAARIHARRPAVAGAQHSFQLIRLVERRAQPRRAA
jgi:hypothetical protein